MDCVVIGTAKELEKIDFADDSYRRLKKYR